MISGTTKQMLLNTWHFVWNYTS